MSFISDFAARVAHQWLERFRVRHALGGDKQHDTPATVPSMDRHPGERLLLHVGCGHASIENIGLTGFHNLPWREIRLDADQSVAPDIVGSMTEMPAVPDSSVDAVFSSHGIEHLYWFDVPTALLEFRRVLNDDGILIITCPDLQAAAQMIAEDKMFDTAYVSAAGPITPFDILFSYRPFVQANPQWMSHHCGFTISTLIAEIRQAGFPTVHGIRRLGAFDLWVLASKSSRPAEEMAALAAEYLPTAG